MRLACLQDTLDKGLGIVSRAVASRTTLPITQNILLQTDQGRLRLSATNLELAISTWVGAKIEEEGAITVPARLLTEFVSSLPQDTIDVEAVAHPYALRLTCANNQARIIGTEPEEFPPLPTVEGGVTAMLNPRALRNAISQVVFAVATEDSRPVLTGIKVELENEKFTFAAADGFRLAVHRGELAQGVSEPVHAIIPARAFSELGRLLGDQEQPVEMLLDATKGQVLFRLKDVEVISQLIQGTFPNYAQLLPESYTTRASLPVQEFLRATRTSSIFARDSSGIVRLHVRPGEEGTLQVVARAEEVGENNTDLGAEVEGEEAKVAFNGKYLLDVLGAISEERVFLEVTTPSSPGVLRPVSPVSSDSYVNVIMPMFVQW